MKPLSLLVASLAVPAMTFAQTPITPATGGQAPYIALFGSDGGGGTTTGGSNSTWFIDVAKNQVVLCSLGGAAAGGQSFTCTAQPVPAAVPAAGGATPPAAGTPATGTPGT